MQCHYQIESFCNSKRLHSVLGYLSSAEYEAVNFIKAVRKNGGMAIRQIQQALHPDRATFRSTGWLNFPPQNASLYYEIK